MSLEIKWQADTPENVIIGVNAAMIPSPNNSVVGIIHKRRRPNIAEPVIILFRCEMSGYVMAQGNV
jgi:hypothetical protein